MLKSWAQSSMDSEQISNSIRGAILGAGAVIIWAAQNFAHVQLGDAAITALAVQLGGAGAAVWTIYGLLMKAFMRVAKV